MDNAATLVERALSIIRSNLLRLCRCIGDETPVPVRALKFPVMHYQNSLVRSSFEKKKKKIGGSLAGRATASLIASDGRVWRTVADFV